MGVFYRFIFTERRKNNDKEMKLSHNISGLTGFLQKVDKDWQEEQ